MAAARAPPSEEAMQTRIIDHMNNDHQDSLVRYLEHYCHVSSHTARDARIVDCSLSWLALSTSPPRSSHKKVTTSGISVGDTPPKTVLDNHDYLVPLDPPLTSYSQFRQRVVEMDQTCIKALGRSDITVKEYRRARGFHLVVGLAAVMTVILLGWRPSLDPASGMGGGVWSELKRKWPRVFQWLYRIQPWVLYPMLATHLGEAIYIDQSRLRPHSIPRLSTLWWKWVVSTFIEGFGNFQRFDVLVVQEKAKKEKAKH